MRRWLPLVFLALTAAAHPGSVKWFCENFEGAETEARFGSCSALQKKDPDVAAAFDRENRARQQCIELINSGVSQKRVSYDPTAAKACVAAQSAYLKDPARARARHEAMRTACARVVRGRVQSGQACESALDCQGDQACIGPRGAPPGTCKARLKDSEACDDELLGGSRFYATLAETHPLCRTGTHCSSGHAELACVPDVQEGQSCKGAGDCALGLRCAQGTCRPETLAPLGQSCEQTADCATGLWCTKNKCALKQRSGAHCSMDAECRGACRSGICAALCGSG